MAVAGNPYLFENPIGFAGLLVFGVIIIIYDSFEGKNALNRLDLFVRGKMGGKPLEDSGFCVPWGKKAK